MDKLMKVNNIVAILGVMTFVYSFLIAITEITALYTSLDSFFGSDSSLISIIIVLFVCLTPLSFLLMSLQAYTDKVTWYSIPMSLVAWFFIGGITVIGYILVFFVWFVSKHR